MAATGSPPVDDAAWDALQALPAWRVTEIPRDPRPVDAATKSVEAEGLRMAARARAAVFSAAFHRGGSPVAWAWLRGEAAGPVQILAAGRFLASATDGSQTVLKVPAGGRGVPVPEREGLAGLLGVLPWWVPVAGVADSLLAEPVDHLDRDAGRRAPGVLFEDEVLAAWSGSFGWLVVAEPLTFAELDAETASIALRQTNAMRYDDAESGLELERYRARHSELRAGATTGMWRIWACAGGVSAEDAMAVAGLVCASAALPELPYGLTGPAGSRPAALRQALAWPGEATSTGNRSRDGLPPGELRGEAPVSPLAQGFSTSERERQPGPGPYGENVPGAARPAQPAYREWPDAANGAEGRYGQAGAVPRFPFTGSSMLLAELARPPEQEIAGDGLFVLRPRFDVIPEVMRGEPGRGVLLGQVLDANRLPVAALRLPGSSLNRHTFVAGATGAGKSQTVRNLLEQATGEGIPWLVIEPAKAEYAAGMASRLAGLPDVEVIRITPGDTGQAPAGINPLEPAGWADGSRFPLQTHADLTRALFLAAFDAEEPFPQVLAAALTRVYEECGWDLVLSRPASPGGRPPYPTLADLQRVADRVVLDIGYGPEVEKNIRGFITVRLGSLRLGTPGRFLQGGHPIDFGRLLDRNVVLEIEDVGDDQDKAFLMGAVLVRLTEHLRLRKKKEHDPGGLRHLTVLEEAHRLLRRPQPGETGAAAKAVEMFASLMAEVRAYGEGLVVAEQIPAKLIEDVIKNTAVKIIHRLPAEDDRQAVGATMNLTDEQSEYVVTLPPGHAAAFADGADYPWLIHMPDGSTREDTNTAARSASPDRVISPRSPSCGTACRSGSPCTLAQIRQAQLPAVTPSELVLWAELATAAHLAGWPAPDPRPQVTQQLTDLDERLLDCAISHACDAAAAARAPAINQRIDPAELAAHVATMMRTQLSTGRRPCRRPEPAWLAPAFCWHQPAEVLAAAVAADPGAPRHPDTAQWEHDRGQAIPGRTSAEQLTTIRRRQREANTGATRQIDALFGTVRPSVIEATIGGAATDPDWRTQLARTLTSSFTQARAIWICLAPEHVNDGAGDG